MAQQKSVQVTKDLPKRSQLPPTTLVSYVLPRLYFFPKNLQLNPFDNFKAAVLSVAGWVAGEVKPFVPADGSDQGVD